MADLARLYATDLVDRRARLVVRISRAVTPVLVAGMVPVVVFTHLWPLVAAGVLLCSAHVAAEVWMRGQRRLMLAHMWNLAARSADPVSEMAAFQAFRRLSAADRRAVLAWDETDGHDHSSVPPGVARFRAALRVLPHEL